MEMHHSGENMTKEILGFDVYRFTYGSRICVNTWITSQLFQCCDIDEILDSYADPLEISRKMSPCWGPRVITGTSWQQPGEDQLSACLAFKLAGEMSQPGFVPLKARFEGAETGSQSC